MSDDVLGEDGDLREIYEIFFEEAVEHLAAMEGLLLHMDVASPDAEQLNAIFRAAHSIKGGAATFGFDDMAELTHQMETVFDRVRKQQMPLSSDLVDVFLASGDTLKSMVAARRGQAAAVSEASVAQLCVRLRAFLGAPPSAPDVAPPPAAPAPTAPRSFELVLGPLGGVFEVDAVTKIVAALRDTGEIEVVAATTKQRGSRRKHRERRFTISTVMPESELRDALAFLADPALVKLTPMESGPTGAAPAVAGPSDAALEQDGFGLFVDVAASPPNRVEEQGAPAAEDKVVELSASKRMPEASAEAASIRVSVRKVDQLINMVGELVITQAMLAQAASHADPLVYEALFNGIAQLQRNTRDLHEAAMSIRMMPISSAFSRFPRLVRDMAAKLDKEVDLHTIGEGTELDKGLIERIVDPLTHLVRNSLDHGVEGPEERVAKGKPRRGTITLRAYHQGGAIIIEVSDDGRGLMRDKILAKARERGFAAPDAMSDQEVWQLIFEPGLSTAVVVSEVSGRGVGMDVVRRNIQEMGGRVDIETTPDVGTRMSIRLPLTLAIMDGMSVRVGEDIFIIPLGYICESLQPRAGAVRTVVGRGRLILVRGEYVPVISLAQMYGVKGANAGPVGEQGIIIILEADAGKTALVVDELVGQHQVVIKSLETNYRKIAGVSGATIMGDGRVAMILDVGHIVRMTHSHLDQAA